MKKLLLLLSISLISFISHAQESIINSLNEGFNPATEEALEREIKDREKILTMPNKAPEFKMSKIVLPKSYGNDEMMSSPNTVDYSQEIELPNSKNEYVENYYQQKIQNSDAIKNNWTSTVYKHEPYMDKFIALGYDIEKTESENVQRYKNNGYNYSFKYSDKIIYTYAGIGFLGLIILLLAWSKNKSFETIK